MRRHIREIVTTRVCEAIHEPLLELLRRPGYALHPEGACRAGGLALQIHGAVSREPPGRTAYLAAAAVECLMDASYALDDVADNTADGTCGTQIALATALVTAGVAAAVEAAAHSPAPSVALEHFCRAYSESSAGQYLDAMLQQRGGATLEEALETTCLKSGGLGRFVTGFAARVAGADGDGIALFERLGDDIFTLAQILDDLRDACDPDEASDLAQGKATLPVVFYGRENERRVPADGMLSAEVRNRYESSGAPLYAGILAHAYMSRAEEDLVLLSRRGYDVEGLLRFLQDVDSGAGDILGAARRSLVA
ncbi:MAG TPA: polyprenyl synthetase family protein [Candidatus Polarisedimenticolia bacterium]|nr:polyprenyl synthetase family protein [Candidatus Polarisedimenticolia bacterium]